MSHVTLTDLKEIEPAPGFKGRFVHSDHVTLAYWNIAAGAALPQHAHMHEQAVIARRAREATHDGHAQAAHRRDQRSAIDAAVYRLYDLSAEEIRVVEGGN